MSKIENLSERLMARADAELRDRITQAAKGLYTFLDDGCAHCVNARKSDDTERASVDFRSAWESIKETAFEINRDENRRRRISEFMAKVENLESQIVELRDSIPD